MKIITFFDKMKGKKTTIFLVIGLVGLLLILLSDFLPQKSTVQTNIVSDIEQYQIQLQKEITNLVQKINGAGSCEVLVTLESGPQYIYATENRKNTNITTDSLTDGKQRDEQNSDFQNSYIIIRNSDGSESPVLIQEISPVIKGVVVLCKGGSSSVVKQMVTEAVTTAFNISSNKVTVILKA